VASPAGLLNHPNSESDDVNNTTNMSYAQAVKDHGPPQSDSEASTPQSIAPHRILIAAQKMPDTVPEIAHSDSGVHSIDSLSSDTVNIPSYAEQQKQAEERAEAAKREAQQTADQVGKDAKEFGKKAEGEAKRLEAQGAKKYQQFTKDAGKEYEKVKGDLKSGYERAKKEFGENSKEAKEEARKLEEWTEKNKNNPVVIGNAVVITALAALLGTGAYRAHRAGSLTWRVAGAWAGVVGLFAVGDYYVSQYVHRISHA
jgi:hypothetical protein